MIKYFKLSRYDYISLVEVVSSLEEKYKLLVELFSIIVEDGIYAPFDKIVRAIDRDTVMSALYDAMRYLAPDLRRCGEYFKCLQTPEEREREECVGRFSRSEQERCDMLLRVFKDPSKLVEGLRLLDELIEEVSRGSLTKVRKLAMLAVRRGMERALGKYVKGAKTTAS
jgi:hypothetical protein